MNGSAEVADVADIADVVVIGGGVIGASVAWHLASRGCRDVVVLERHAETGRGSTGRATGGFRAQFSSEVEVRLSLLAREKLRRFAEETGVDPGYRPCGYLFLAADEGQLALLRSLLPIQRRAGLEEVREITVDDARRLNPAIRTEGTVGGTFCSADGFLRPLEILRGYAEAGRRLGVRWETGAEVTGVRVDHGRVAGVETSRGPVSARHVVNAAGAWAGLLARSAGIELPVRPVRRQVAITEPFDGLPEDMPMTIFLEDGFHLRVRDGRVLLLWPAELPSPDPENPFDTTFDATWLDGVLARALPRVPCLAEARIDRPACWAGLYEMTPDQRVIVGPAPGVDGLWLANGSSGHGVMHSPALGQLVAEMILDGRAHTIDVGELGPERFAADGPPPRPALL